MDKIIAKILDLQRLGGDFQQLRIAIRGGKDTSVFSAGLNERAHLLWGVDRPILYIASDRPSAIKAQEVFKEFFGDGVALLLERGEHLIYHGAGASRNEADRLEGLFKLKRGEARVTIITPESLMQKYPSPHNVKEMTICESGSYDIDNLAITLVDMGYKRADIVEQKGEFAIKGDIFTLFPVNSEYPLRLSFFDDMIEYITQFELDTLQKVKTFKEIAILPTTEFVVSDAKAVILAARKESKKIPGDARVRMSEILDEIEFNVDEGNGNKYLQWLNLYGNNSVLLDEYLSADTVIVFDGGGLQDNARLCYNEFTSRHTALLAEGEVLPVHINALTPFDNVIQRLEKYCKVMFASITSSSNLIQPKHKFNFHNIPSTNYYMNISTFYNDIKANNRNNTTTVICCGDEHTAKSIKSSLYEQNIFAALVDRDIDLDKIRGVVVTSSMLSGGMVYPTAKLCIIGRTQLIKKREKPIDNRKRRMFVMPKCGDYVVHEVHGIGLCVGIERLENKDSKKDYVVLQYEGANKLYVPVDQMDRLQRYSGSDVVPKLSKIGGRDWDKVKEKVKNSVREMAFSLVELYRNRQQTTGYKYPKDGELQKVFEDKFEWQETDDQLRAVEEIKADMERGIVMDRLVCGDVGYGKTEVALRAIFKTIAEGKQAAILAPTTILARQHYSTVLERFEGFGINTVLLSRFQTKQEINVAIAKIKTGQANLIIATHKLLSDSVKFSDLGLLVLDEEQRFGVEHKEKIKLNVHNVNVLTLSATPIPRTLNMALTGIRDISVLETPPLDRQPVATYVTELTDALLQDAINRELSRGGQVFVLYNRVDRIESVAARVRELSPQANVIVGHGQMTSHQLEHAINSFYNGESNVFVATTIIENGVNLPNANTIIVCDADRLGLSAMYQLRGRVGRSNRLAYAYFTTPATKALTSDAMKRLNAIMDYTDFGSGYKIAMRDLEIRGAGNVLGREQHGHICKVGYDMYCKMLQEAVEEISGIEVSRKSDVEMQIDINAYLGENYISNIDEKLRVFKEIAEVSSNYERNTLIKKLSDNYGKPDEEVVNLIDIALLKHFASEVGASKVIVTERGAGIWFSKDVFKNNRVMSVISDMKDMCVLSVETSPKLIFDVKNLDITQKIEVVRKFLINILKNN